MMPLLLSLLMALLQIGIKEQSRFMVTSLKKFLEKITILESDNLKGEIEQLSEMVKQGKKVQHYETTNLKKNATMMNVSLTLSPIIDQSGKIVSISCIAGDITEKKISEKLFQEKRLAEVANTTKSDFLAKISHELRTH
jgi:hypothetical protein